MKITGHLISLVICSTACFLGCNDDGPSPFDRPVVDRDCDNVESPKVVVLDSVLSFDGTSLILRGTASLPSGLTIRQLRVGAVPATSDTFNFSTWTVTVPESAWRFFDHSATKFNLPLSVDDSCKTHDLKVDAPMPKGAIPEPTDDDNVGGQPTVGGQPAVGGQPTGGQPAVGGQPAGGQPTGGQPTGGQPTGGQPTGGGQPAVGGQADD